ncbi:MAG: cyclic nucleotide-binding domain-containing protein [Planctomycetes bacterium]|nr:cyclic nucleotide-binding domain-containing protein [Planctomycetota bacterium]
MDAPTPERLRRYSLFGGLIDAQLDALIGRIRTESVPAGAVLMREGERGDRLYCLVEGEVEVRRGDRVLVRLGPGETLGEMEIIDMQPRSATVTALTPCVLYGLALRDILALQRSDLPAFTLVIMNLARDLSRRLRRMDGIPP